MSSLPHTRSGSALAILALGLGACLPPLEPAGGCPLDDTDALYITELMPNPAGADGGHEWVELWNGGQSPIELGGLLLEGADGDASKRHVLAAGTLAPGAFLVLGDADEAALPPHVGVSYGGDLGALRNADGRLALRCGTRVLDEVAYASSAEGHALGRSGAGAILGVLPAGLCEATLTEYAPDAWGSPGAPNERCDTGLGGFDGGVDTGDCIDAEGPRPAVVPGPGDLLITELMANPAAVADIRGEWVEVYLRRDVDLNGLGFGADLSGAASIRLEDEACLRFTAGTHVVVARSAADNGGLPRVDVVAPVSLVNSGGSFVVSHGGVVLDALAYGASTPGVSYALGPDDDGAYPDEERPGCDGADPYGGGDLGTPGTPNPPCDAPPDDGGCRLTPDGAVLPPPGPGDLRIAEVMANPAAVLDTAGEWAELSVERDVDLSTVVVVAGASSLPLTAQSCLPAAAGTRLLLARNASPDSNGGLPEIDHVMRFTLANSAGELSLVVAEQTIDALGWATARAGVALVRAEGDATCEATEPYGDGDLGTPGAPSVCAP